MVYFELGRLPLFVIRKIRMFKYWFHLLHTNNCILSNVYQVLLTLGAKYTSKNFIWTNFLKRELDSLGLGYIWLSQNNIAQNMHCL